MMIPLEAVISRKFLKQSLVYPGTRFEGGRQLCSEVTKVVMKIQIIFPTKIMPHVADIFLQCIDIYS